MTPTKQITREKEKKKNHQRRILAVTVLTRGGEAVTKYRYAHWVHTYARYKIEIITCRFIIFKIFIVYNNIII